MKKIVFFISFILSTSTIFAQSAQQPSIIDPLKWEGWNSTKNGLIPVVGDHQKTYTTTAYIFEWVEQDIYVYQHPRIHVYYAQGGQIYDVMAPLCQGPRDQEFYDDKFVNSPWAIKFGTSKTIFFNNPIRATLVVTQGVNEYQQPEQTYKLIIG